MLSWFSALTITPVLIKWWLFKNQSQPVAQANANPYGGRFYRLYQQALQALLLRKTLTLTIMAALLAAAIWGSDRCGKTFSPRQIRRFSLSISGSRTVPISRPPKR